jgi:glutamine synthetase
MPYQAEYIWIDGTKPTPLLRSKTKILDNSVKTPPIWGFDGSSTEQATGESSDCMLKPVYWCKDPIRGGKNILVMCEVYLASTGLPHPTNTRAACAAAAEKYKKHGMIYGIEQEYTFMRLNGRPFGFPELDGEPGPQGPYYCGVGAGRVMGRDIVELHTEACIEAGLTISGTNAEVMPGQWEFQIGPLDALKVSDEMYVARWLLHRIAEDFDVVASFDAKPQKGDWNGAGAHTNFSTKAMREGYDAIESACKALEGRVMEHVENYGHDIQSRLTGKHETAPLRRGSSSEREHGSVRRHPTHPRDGVQQGKAARRRGEEGQEGQQEEVRKEEVRRPCAARARHVRRTVIGSRGPGVSPRGGSPGPRRLTERRGSDARATA